MKLAFLYGPLSLGARPLDFDTLYTNRRGLTGSELSFVEYAQAMASRGHDVMVVVGQKNLEPREWRGLRVSGLTSPKIVDDRDVVLAWNEPDLLREVTPRALRVVNQQLNDFNYCRDDWAEHVDLVTSPSPDHLRFLRRQVPKVDTRGWAVLPNGCDPTLYREVERVPGRVVWASSADRGLHRLLEAWPEVKRRVPHASLRAFYNFQPAEFDDYEVAQTHVRPDLLEVAQRKRYIQHATKRLADPRWDVEHVGSVGRERLRLELERAEVLGYPCDTIRYTEGFSVTTMEACAAGVLPVITDIDALGQIYADAAPMVRVGGVFRDEHLPQYVELLVRGLTDPVWRQEHVDKCRARADLYAWPRLAETLEGLLSESLRQKRKSDKWPKRKVSSGRPDAEAGR